MNEELRRIHRELEIPRNYEQTTSLSLQTTPSDLTSIGNDVYGRPQQLRANAAEAWFRMRDSALNDQILIEVVSAYRSLKYQVQVIQRLLDAGESIDDILTRVAAPGFSEHQSGCALDLTTKETEDSEEEFEESDAFSWLETNAASFGYYLSYPKNNKLGVIYEPWHWCYRTG